VPDRYELTFEVTRDDWIAVNEALCRTSASWDAIARGHRRSLRRQTLWLSPLVAGGITLAIGRAQATQGMHVLGAVRRRSWSSRCLAWTR
jgi:hypothetical protein